ncbi:glutaredoxin [Geodermatophilus normandii]|uniref:Glutaredoxin n=1 Tax=Geodermatophilus normandii TaxID=1137989 RepID=A0A317QE84_9ACTN|nr:glutaredoxin domain-containing protein [Geodermatophilus normandii]PWW21211.1 glutaredoxin [Geodermatophilus normandii]
MTDEPVTVYVKPGCPFSAKLRATMTLARVPHRAVRFSDDPEGAAAVRAHHPEGWEVSPTVVVGGRYLTNPSLREVRAAIAAR